MEPEETPKLKKIFGQYHGPELLVLDKIDKQYLILIGLYDDGIYRVLDLDKCTLPVPYVVDNTLNYTEIWYQENDTIFYSHIHIPTYPLPIELKVTYIDSPYQEINENRFKFLDTKVHPSEFIAEVTYLLNDFEKDSRKTITLDDNDIELISESDIISKENNGWFDFQKVFRWRHKCPEPLKLDPVITDIFIQEDNDPPIPIISDIYIIDESTDSTHLTPPTVHYKEDNVKYPSLEIPHFKCTDNRFDRTLTLTASAQARYFNKFKCWYEGPDIFVGEKYDPTDLRIFLIDNVGHKFSLPYNNPHVKIDISCLVNQLGENKYDIAYDNRFQTHYYVEGIKEWIYADHEFKLLHIEPDGTKTDLTADFNPVFTFADVTIITWQRFVNRLKQYVADGLQPPIGEFILFAPKRTGLFNQYASVWHVEVQEDFDIEALLIKIITDEEGDSDAEKEKVIY